MRALLLACSSTSGVLHFGQRLAKPGLSGLSSNSSSHTTQILIGNGISLHNTTLLPQENPSTPPSDSENLS
jgi:hypothetical protein